MSGHSKWSKVKHQKATTDAVKSRAFTHASRAVTVAVQEGGGITDPNKNFRLRLAIEKAHDVNMPRVNIERAIAKAGESGGASFEQMVYEGYGPGGVAILVEAATDNHQRTAANIKHQFDHAGGSIASPGAVSFLFVRKGILVVEKNGKSFDAILDAAITAGADDVVERSDMYEVYTDAHTLSAVKENLVASGWKVDNWEIIMKPTNPMHLDDESLYRQNETLIEALEELEDVQSVFSILE